MSSDPVHPSPVAQRAILLVLSAPSGAGKTTLARRFLGDHPEAVFSVSTTTRSPRGKERDGVDYHFVDTATFRARIEKGEFIEWAEVHGHFYGTPQAVVDQAFATGGIAVFDIDVQGGSSIKKRYPQTILAFVLPPSIQELERRLRERGTDAEETILRRMLAARSEMERGIASYDYLIVNDHIDKAYQDLSSVIRAEQCRRERVDLAQFGLDSVLRG